MGVEKQKNTNKQTQNQNHQLSHLVNNTTISIGGIVNKPQGVVKAVNGEDIKRYSFSETAKIVIRFSNNGKLIFAPKYKVTIGGIEVMFTDTIHNIGENPYIIGYVVNKGIIEPRIFYKSLSGGNWHCAIGIEKTSNGRRLSKGEFLGLNYEKGTIIDPKMAEILEKTDKIETFGTGLIMLERLFGYLNKDNFPNNNEFECKKLIMSVFANFSKNYTPEMINQTFEEVGKILHQRGVVIRFDLGLKKGKGGSHKLLGDFESYIGVLLIDGEKVEVEFAFCKDDKDLIWVENVNYIGVKNNSYLIPSKQVNLGLLLSKPLEYEDQVPTLVSNNGRNIGGYIDIRPFIQRNPLIVEFKKEFNKGANI